MKVVLAARAKADLREIASYIARANKPRAILFVAELRGKAKGIGGMPLGFPVVPR